MTSSSHSLFRSELRRFDIIVDLRRKDNNERQATEAEYTQRLRELLPGPLFPDEVRFWGDACFFNYSSRSRADEALVTLRRVISFDSTSPVDRALRAANPSATTLSPTNGKHTLFFGRGQPLPDQTLRAALKRLLGGDNLMLPHLVGNSSGSNAGTTYLEFHCREALERALRIFGDIPADSNDKVERALRLTRILHNTSMAYAQAAGYRGDVSMVCHDFLAGRCNYANCKFTHPDGDGGGGGGGGGGGAHARPAPPAAPRFRMFRCELCRYELDEREFPPTEIAEHAQAPRCARCCERREAEKRREWEEEQRRDLERREEERRVYGDLPAGGGAAAYHHLPPPPHQPPPAHQQFYQYQTAQQQQQHPHVGQRHGREDYGDDGFPARPRGSW